MADRPRRNGRRGRFRTAADAAEQLADIKAAQRAVRSGRSDQIINGAEKSRQRLQNMMNHFKGPDAIKDAFQ